MAGRALQGGGLTEGGGPSLRLLVPDLAVFDAALEGPPALGGVEVAEGWEGLPRPLASGRGNR